MGIRAWAYEVVAWVRGLRAVLRAMAELDRPPPDRSAHLRELSASPPPRPRPAPAPARVRRKTVAPAAARVARQKPKSKPKPGVKVKRGQKHR